MKNLSNIFEKLNVTKIKETLSKWYYRDLGDIQNFFKRNRKWLFMILTSFLIVIVLTIWLISHSSDTSERTLENSTPKKPMLQSPLANSIKQSVEPIINQKLPANSIVENNSKDSTVVDLHDELLFLLSDNLLYPTTPIEEFSNKYNKLQPLNNFAKADTKLIMKEYDSIIEHSIKDSCTFNFERRRKK